MSLNQLPGKEAALYVSQNGRDTASGSLSAPFATLERARDEARKLAKPVTIYVRAGVYELPRTFELGPEDSGTAYRAYGGEKPVLTGAKRIEGFVPHQGRVLKTSLAAQGFPRIYFRQLFYQGRRQHLARYPNFDPRNPYGGGWAYAAGAPVPMYKDLPGEDKHTLAYKPEDARGWSRPDEGEVFVFPRYNWWNNIVGVKSLDPEKRAITLRGNCSYPIRPGDRYYVRNLFEELDAPGEWYLDKQAWTLYFWPPGETPGAVTVWAPRLRTILEIRSGAANITIRGFTFEFSEGTAMVLTGTSNCLIAGNTIRNAGDYNGSGVAVNGGSNNGVAGNDIYEIGSQGIALTGGDRITLTPSGNYADNNYIHHTGVFYKQGCGISMHGCGLRASHNLIHDTPRFGIYFMGNNLLLEYNHIHHVNLETADTGAVYTGGRDWLGSRGTIIRYNYMHDSIGFGQDNGKWVSPHYSWGVYLDDNTGGVDVIGNIVVRAMRGLIHLHNGRDNLIENNIFVDGKLQQVEYNGWNKASKNWATHLPTMVAGYDSVKDQPAWKAMRNMETRPEQAVLPDGLIMTGNVFRRNIVAYSDPASKLFGLRNVPFDHNEWSSNLYWHDDLPVTIEPFDRGSLAADPLFVNRTAGDYRLRPGSPAFKLGFQPIPVDKIGPYKDELRASWPMP